MVKGQVSLEFLFSILIYLYIVVVIVTSVFRAYNFVSAERLQIRADLISGGIAKTIMESSGTSGWENDPYVQTVKQVGISDQQAISYTKLAALKGLSYGELKKLFNVPYDFKVTVRYLPSIVIDVRPENPVIAAQGERTFGPNTFDSSEPSRFIVVTKDFELKDINSEVYAIVETSENSYLVEKATEFSNAYRVSLNLTTPGTYTITFLAMKTVTHQFGKTDYTISVISK